MSRPNPPYSSGYRQPEDAEIGQLLVDVAGEMVPLVPVGGGTARHLALDEPLQRLAQRRDRLALVEIHLDRPKTGGRFSAKARTASA